MTALNELNKINIQNDHQAYLVISNHLLTQNDRALGDDSDTCSYRGMTESIYDDDGYAIDLGYPTGLSCAVGCLIKDAYYDPYIEGNGVQNDKVLYTLVKSHPDWEINGKTVLMLACLQRIHDRYKPKDWPYMLVAVDTIFSTIDADRYNLSNVIKVDDEGGLNIDYDSSQSPVGKILEETILKLKAESFDVMTGSSAAICADIIDRQYNRIKDNLVYNEKGE